MVKVFVAVLVGTVVLIVVFASIASAIQPTPDYIVETNEGNKTTTSISVSISGEITRPGTYLMEPDTYLSELIETANGVTSNADELAYDVNYMLKDGYSFYIAPKYDKNDVCTLDLIVKVNINTDTSEQLQTISGIGNTVATAIVNYRSSHGEFRRIEDLKNVTGIGNATFEKIKNFVRLRDN